MSSAPIKIVLADVDGTLVTPAKALTERTVAAVAQLHDAGVELALTSGRPPRGMSMLVAPLGLRTPIAAFNGGVIVRPDMSVLEQRLVPDEAVRPALALLEHHGLAAWVYTGADWLVRDPHGAHVAREQATVRFAPTAVAGYDHVGGVAKIVGVSDDHERVTAATEEARERFGEHVSAAQSQPYYLDITHPQANKGEVVSYLSSQLGIAVESFAAIGDMPNDVLMFAHAGLSIAMGNATPDVQRAARRVTASNDDDGFAEAIERFVLAPAAQSRRL